MLDRLLGLETEYAIRFTSDQRVRPRNDTIYETLAASIGRLVRVRPGERRLTRNQFFTENGGAFCYEFLPIAPAGGLVEGATPECRGPSQLLLYQKAQDALLLEALPHAEELLGNQGFSGTLGLLKNCRDAEGHVFGAQENYEVEVASGLALVAYRIGLALLLPVVALQTLVGWLLVIALASLTVLALLVAGLAVHLVPRLKRRFGSFERLTELAGARLERVVGRHSMWLEEVLWWPSATPFSLLVRLVGFRPIRTQALAFLLSRPVLTGCGTLDDSGRFGLSEKGPSIRRLLRLTVSPDDRSVFDVGNLMKFFSMPLLLRFSPLKSLFRRRQRLQLGLSDSNLAQLAEYLKIGTTSLVLDMVEAGLLRDAPRLEDPVEALHSLIADPGLRARVQVRASEPLNALEIQRFYLERARRFVSSDRTPSLEAREIVRLWSEALDALEKDPSRLVGRLDWVTKKSLLEQCGQAPAAALKKLDLRYHELGQGYLAKLEDAGIAPRLVTREEVHRARTEPPEATPASVRGRLIKSMVDPKLRLTVAWDSVRIGGPWRAKVIPLDRYRRSRDTDGKGTGAPLARKPKPR